MSIVTISTAFNIDLEFHTAPFHKRLLAWTVDLLIICVYYYIMLNFVWELRGEAGNTLALLLIVLPVFFYHLLSEILMNGQSLGKKVVGIKVIDREGKEPTKGQYVLRWMLCLGNYVLYIIPYVALIYFGYIFFFVILYIPDILSVAISAKSQRLGDLAAGTIVIDQKAKTGLHDTIYLDIEEDNYTPVFPQIMQLSDRDINGIRNLLAAQRNEANTFYAAQIAGRIKQVLNIETDMDPRDFMEQLLRDYNYMTRK